jgi:hypothetical protein
VGRKGRQRWHIQNPATLGRCLNHGPAVFLPLSCVLKGENYDSKTKATFSVNSNVGDAEVVSGFSCYQNKNTIAKPT